MLAICLMFSLPLAPLIGVVMDWHRVTGEPGDNLLYGSSDITKVTLNNTTCNCSRSLF